jgi:hypothetical protein
VRRNLFAALRALVVPTLGVVAVAAFLPGRLDPAVRIYALVLCGIAVLLALAALRRAYPPATPLAERPRAAGRQRRPPSLARLEHVAALGVAGSFDLHHRLRPRLRSLAAELLSGRRRVSLDGRPDVARRALGAETYDLVRANRPPPEDRLAHGLTVTELRDVVESLERV